MENLKSQLLIINSKDRTSGTVSNFNYSMKYYGTELVQGYRVNKITIPFSWYTVVNQSFTLTRNAVDHIIYVDPGQWSAIQLAANIQARLETDVGVGLVKFSWASGSNTFTFESLDVNVLTLKFDEAHISAPTPSNNYLNFGVLTGFVLPSDISVHPTGLDITGQYAVNLAGTPNVYVKSQSLQLYGTSYFQRVSDNVIQSVPVDVNVGNYIVWQNSVATIFKNDDTRMLGNYDLQLVDEWNNLVDLRGLDWVIEIQIYSNL